MAHIDRTFTISEAVALAQESFKEDVGPYLHRVAELALYKDEPGRLGYSDGIRDPSEFPGQDGGIYTGLRMITAHRLHVVFQVAVLGTEVSLSGSLPSREVRDALSLLGNPGHWPHRRGGAGS